MRELIERLEKLTAPDRGVDGRIAWALGWRFNGFIWNGDDIGGPDTVEDFDEWPHIGGSWKKPGDPHFFGDSELSKSERREGEADGRWDEPPHWTGSVDAAIALAEEVLPLKSPDIIREALSHLGKKYDWHICFPTAKQIAELPISICLAVLRAKEGEK